MQNKDVFPPSLLLLTWQAHFAARVCFSTCPDSQKCHAGLALLQSSSDSAAVPRWAAGGGVSQLGLEPTQNPPRWERPGQPRAALPALGWHLGHTAVCVGHGKPVVAQAEVDSVDTEHPCAQGEADSPAEVGKEAPPGSPRMWEHFLSSEHPFAHYKRHFPGIGCPLDQPASDLAET